MEWDNRNKKLNVEITEKNGLFVSQLVPEKKCRQSEIAFPRIGTGLNVCLK